MCEKYIDYFLGIDKMNSFGLSSGNLGETAFKELYQLTGFKEQSRNGNHRYDFETHYAIYEIKNYLWDSTGTADEKLLYGCLKYVDSKKDIVIVLCAQMEEKFKNQLPVFMIDGIRKTLIDNNILIVNLSDIIIERYFSNIPNMIKWVGSKRSCLDKIVNKISELKTSETTYIEPFVGSGIVLKEVMSRKLFTNYIISDSNKYLIKLFETLKEKKIEEIIEELKAYEEIYNETSDKEDFYYSFRDIFNKESSTIDLSLFLFLNKTCFRGLFRLNKNGFFNVPFGNYKQIHFNYDELIEFQNIISQNNVTITCSSYDSLELSQGFIYADPPYENTFDGYDRNGFDHEHFKDWCKNSHNRILISNSQEFDIEDFQSETFEITEGMKSGKKRIEKLLWNCSK